MKIIVLTNNFYGLYCFRKEVISALIKNGHEITVSASFDEKAKDVENLGCRILDTSFNSRGKNPLNDFKLLLFYRRLLKQEKPDVVLSYTIKPNLYGGVVCQLCHIPQIANITGLGSAVENKGWLQKIIIVLYRFSLRKAKMVFFQNQANKCFCEEHRMVQGRTLLLPGSGVNLDFHKFQDYPSIESNIKFVFVSRLMREKGIDEYLFAAESIKSKYPDVEFHIVGSCEESYGNIVNNLQNRGIVTYHGSIPDVRPVLVKCHCVVLPSFYPEGMSNVLLEACATGRPIITTDRPGCGEIVDDGDNGFLVKQKDANNLTEMIEKFIYLPYDRRKEMGINARKKVEKQFNREIVIDAYLREVETI